MEFLRYFLLILLVICALTACIGKNLLTAVVKYMSFSLIMSVIWVLLQSPEIQKGHGAQLHECPLHLLLKGLLCCEASD